MNKLFVALELPETAVAALVAAQPPPSPGHRLVDPGQMHLTLHFIGEAAPQEVAGFLDAVEMSQFTMSIHGVGHFTSPMGATTLWAGVQQTPELLSVHRATASALSVMGFEPESRPYTPHITLARCEAGMPPAEIEEYIAKHAGLSVDAEIKRLGLYSSSFVEGVPVYSCERWFQLVKE